jgi:outer membrane protein insertion porin family
VSRRWRPTSSRGLLLLALLAGAWTPAATARAAQAQADVPRTRAASDTVVSLEVSGNLSVDSALVVNTFAVKTGRPLDRDRVRRGVKALYALGLFSDVSVDARAVPRGLHVVIGVTEKPRLSAVEFSGNDRIETDKLREKAAVSPGTMADRKVVQEVRDRITALYVEEGYAQAEVKANLVPGRVGEGMVLAVSVDEGEKVKVASIAFEGNDSVPAGKLRKQMDTKTRTWWGRGGYQESKLREDLGKIEAWYRKHGFKDAAVVDHRATLSPDLRTVDVVIRVREGALFRMGEVSWSGNTKVATGVLAKGVKFEPGDIYNREKVDRVLEEAYSAYAEEGYLYVGIEPAETVDGGRVHLAFQVTEGEPSMVREVRILGNTHTKERVIRRELTVAPGQKFRRSWLVRSQRDAMALGFFQNVGVRYEPVEGSPDIDLIFDVEEKQTGTASAGFGFSSQSGLTGFLELGHNNLFGNGNNVALRLERGSRRNQYELSYTEPWFLDTPTSLGIELYNTRLLRDIYEQKRLGGAASVSRPLPWIDYARAGATYRIEDVEILQGGTSSEDANPDSLGLVNGLTSSLSLSFTRNSANHPFYPTGGSRFSWSAEFAGGPFGGDVDFQKYTVENRLYLRPIWKPALLLRARVGYVGPYEKGKGVPGYETFRLGGTTIDYLRGYPDYSVVPEGNVILLPRPRSAVDDTGAVHTDTTYVRTPWPGGRFATWLTAEFQFLLVEPVHGLCFFDMGGAWNNVNDFRWGDFRKSAGIGLRFEIPLLGQIGLDYAYGFDRTVVSDPGWRPHLLLGRSF